MQNVKKQSRLLSWVIALVITSAMVWACNNEAPKTEETKTDSVTPAPAPAAPVDTTKHDSLPKVDTTAKKKPDGKG